VAAGSGGLHIFDVSAPGQPVRLSSTTLPGQVWDVAVSGDRAFVAAGEKGVHILDVSDPTSPVRLGAFQTEAAQGVAAGEDGLFVADGLGGLLILMPSQNPRLFASDRGISEIGESF
jgi:hypothetical protein